MTDIPTCSHPDHSNPDVHDASFHRTTISANGTRRGPDGLYRPRQYAAYYPCPMIAAARKAAREDRELDAREEQKSRWRE